MEHKRPQCQARGEEDMKNYKTGVNFGCWISQYRDLDYGLFKKMITREDCFRIKGWGFDHIRLPFDYPLLLDESDLYKIKPMGIAFLDDMVKWCGDAGLSLLLDLHRAPGYRFQDIGANKLFETPELKDAFTALWVSLAERYRDIGEMLAFDLLNEVAEEKYLLPWIDLAQKTIDEIRKISPKRDILFGGANYNSIHMLGKLPVLDDKHVVYNFHYYEPIFFTHQFASWNQMCMDYSHSQGYPADFKDLGKFAADFPEYAGDIEKYNGMHCDCELLKRDFNFAGEFLEKNKKMVYCGEYGVYDRAGKDDKLNWMNDITGLFNQYKIGRAIWNYTGGGFGLYDWKTREETGTEVVKVITKTW